VFMKRPNRLPSTCWRTARPRPVPIFERRRSRNTPRGYVRETYRQTVRALAEVKGETVLKLSVDAAALFQKWEAEIETMLADGGQMEIMRDWGAKLAGETVRLAAVLHCVVHGPTKRIERPTIAAAIEIARYPLPNSSRRSRAEHDAGKRRYRRR